MALNLGARLPTSGNLAGLHQTQDNRDRGLVTRFQIL
jgi:hypothetical protein